MRLPLASRWLSASMLLFGTTIICQAAPKLVPTSAYETRTLAGWTVRVHRDLLGQRAEAGASALALLEQKLAEVRTLVPARALTAIERVPIWLGVDDFDKPNAVYHPSPEWLRSHGWNPDKAGCVEIPNAAVFIEWSNTQSMMVLHELAHAYHHQVIGHAWAPLREAWQRARESGRYSSVLHANGKHQQAYALSSFEEFFAEASEAYFGRNDFFPFTREDLRQHDPAMHAVVEDVWGW